MNTNVLNVMLATVAATALIAGASLASAQTVNTEQPKASAPMKSDSEKAGQNAQNPNGKKADDTKKAPQTTGQAPRDAQPQPQQQQAQPGARPGESGTQPGQPGQAEGGAQPGRTGTQGQAGQAGGGAQAQISTEQRTQIRQTVMQTGNAPRVSSVTFSLSVGTVVPQTVQYVPLPPRVVEIYPAWRNYHFFIVGDEIVIVEPGSLRIVAVIPA
jgi:hypothetical protein